MHYINRWVVSEERSHVLIALTKNAPTKNAVTKNAVTKNALTKNAVTKNALTKNAPQTSWLIVDGISAVFVFIYSENFSKINFLLMS